MAATLTYDATDTDSSTKGAAGVYTFPLTVAAATGEERLVFVFGAFVGTFGAVAVDGQAATLVGSLSTCNDGLGGSTILGAYRAAGTASTSINVTLTVATGTGFGAGASCYKLAGADTLLGSTNAITNDPVLSVNTANNGAVAAAAFMYTDSSGFSVAWTGLTARGTAFIFGATDDHFSTASANITSASTPLVVSANITPNATVGSSGDAVSALSVSFNPEAVAATDERAIEKTSMMSMGKLMGN